MMEAAGVPVLGSLPWTTPTEADLPLLVKASAGGGGRGMRIVRTLADLPGEIEKARAEAESAFGDGTVFVEPYVEHGRHVEVQVVGTRRRARPRRAGLLDPAPAPEGGRGGAGAAACRDAARAALHDAARKAAEAIDYRGAGTVEFLYDPATERFFFLEMNTRLQVEHPVTELVHGVDLVELQLAVGRGRLEAARRCATARHRPGHAIEVRLYAEDPAADYQPQSGVLTTGSRSRRGRHPGRRRLRVRQRGVHALRRDARQGDRARADPRAGRRAQAGRRAVAGPGSTAWSPTATCWSRSCATEVPRRRRQHGLPRVVSRRSLSSRLDHRGARSRRRSRWPSGPAARGPSSAASRSPGATSSRSRSAPSSRATSSSSGLAAATATPSTATPWSRRARPAVTLETDGVRTTYDVAVTGNAVDVDSPRGHVRLTRVPRFVDPADAVASGSLLAPMPGTVVSGGRRGRTDRWPRASRCWCSRR